MRDWHWLRTPSRAGRFVPQDVNGAEEQLQNKLTLSLSLPHQHLEGSDADANTKDANIWYQVILN